MTALSLHKTLPILAATLALLATSAPSPAQSAKPNPQNDKLTTIAQSIETKVEAAAAELAATRAEIQQERLPLSSELSTLENKLIDVRKDYDRILRIRDGRTLDVSNLKAQIKSREEQNKFLINLLDEYARNLETRLHIAEARRFGDRLQRNMNTALDSNASMPDAFAARFNTLDLSLERLEEAMGGTVFEGAAADPSGVIHQGKFLLLGPLAYFASQDGTVEGLADSKLGSNEPAIIPFPGGMRSGIASITNGGKAALPIDSSLGNAIKVAEATETLADEIRKGGSVMYPLLGLAALSLCIGIYKWFTFLGMQRISESRLHDIIEHLKHGRHDTARSEAEKIRGPIGKMLVAAIKRINEPHDLIEEIIYERLLEAKTRLNAMLPFISITAAAAPLLGLLGTVTGMINTFKLITIFGTGDAQTFSSGISEALITTKWGLIVAIPALLLYGFLSRKAKGILDDMEKVSVVFMNELPDENPNPGDDGSSGNHNPPFTPHPPGHSTQPTPHTLTPNPIPEGGAA